MKIGICLEGQDDIEAVQSLLSKINASLKCPPVHYEVRYHRGYSDLICNLHQTLYEFSELGIELIVVLVDNDRESGHKRLKNLFNKCHESTGTYDLTIPGVAVEALEAWLLADETALSVVTGRTISCLPSPESISYPKEVLQRLTQYHSLGIPYHEILRNIVDRLNLDLVLRRSKSFNRFYGRYSAKVRSMLNPN